MAEAEITLKECRNHTWFDRHILGWAWWWNAYIRDGLASTNQAGFARTREKAQAKAEAAARELAVKKVSPFERYSYDPEASDG